MCPPVQQVIAHAKFFNPLHCTGGHISFLGQGVSRLPYKYRQKAIMHRVCSLEIKIHHLDITTCLCWFIFSSVLEIKLK